MPIIPLSDSSLQEKGWQQQLQEAVRDPELLAEILDIDVARVTTDFPLLVPRPYLDRIQPKDPDDPLLQQVLPVAKELIEKSGFSKDPVSEQSLQAPKGLIQKYQGRVLIVTTGSCAVNCRYCFRRHYPYESQRLSKEDWLALMQYIEGDETIVEVILSGGDPLMLNDRTLASVVEDLNRIPHVSTLRLHTRFPVVIPDRICDSLLRWVDASEKQLVFVTHINHPNELDSALTAALEKLSAHGALVLNQAVLLRGVNDDADVLTSLSQKLFKAKVLPYYLHLLDPVEGAAHFEVSEQEGKALIRTISARLPGYLIPKLAREVAGAPAKQVLIG